MCEPRTDFRLSPFPSPIPTSTCACATPASADGPCSDNNLTRLGSTVNHDHLFPVSLSGKCILYPFLSPVPCVQAWAAPSLWWPVTARRLPHGEHLRRADRPISPPFTLQAQYFVHRFNRAHLFVFSSLNITSTSFPQRRLPSPAREFSTGQHHAPGRFSTSPA